MKTQRNLAVYAAIASLLVLAPWLYVFWTPSLSRKPSDWAEFDTFVGGILSPTLAFAALIGLLATVKQQRDATDRQKEVTDNESYFKHAVSSLERAFSALTDGKEVTAPAHDRLAWLSCARLLLSASNASGRITAASPGLRVLYEGEEEHWRHQFYLLLQPLSPEGVGALKSYFMADRSSEHSPLDERSIKVVYSFAEWPEGRQDSIDAVSKYTQADVERMHVGMSGVRAYVLSTRSVCPSNPDAPRVDR